MTVLFNTTTTIRDCSRKNVVEGESGASLVLRLSCVFVYVKDELIIAHLRGGELPFQILTIHNDAKTSGGVRSTHVIAPSRQVIQLNTSAYKWFISRFVQSDSSVLWTLALSLPHVTIIVGLRVPGGVKLRDRCLIAPRTDNVVN